MIHDHDPSGSGGRSGMDEPARGGQRGADAEAGRGPEGGERDFGSSAGYGHGGSALDHHEVTGEDPAPLDRPNPLDAVVHTTPDRAGPDGERG